jgi:chromate reductase, NAD(P)H dehydrogenase (quinone)
MATGRFQVLGIAGSLRRASYNRSLLRAAEQLAPDGVDVRAFDLLPIPLYNADVEAEGDPAPVRELKEQIRTADALLIASPEYNYSVPGVLKNAIDWASRPPRDSALQHKPVALMGASPGGFGTVRSQLALRQVFLFTRSLVLPEPELYVSTAHEKIDRDGNLTDGETRRRVRALLEALVAWTRRVTAE